MRASVNPLTAPSGRCWEPPVSWHYSRRHEHCCVHAANRAYWDALAAAHGQDDYYDTRALIAGESSLVAEEEQALSAAVGDPARLDGVDIVHVQCGC